MTADEFSAWIEFYRHEPFDDLHRYHRPAALIASSFKGKFDDCLAVLVPKPKPNGYSSADMTLMQILGVKPKPKG